MAEGMTIRRFISALIDAAVALVEERGFILTPDDKETIMRMLHARYSKIRKKNALDEFTTKEDPVRIVEEILEQIIESKQFIVTTPFIKKEHFNSEKALSNLGCTVVSHLVHGILNGDFEDFSSVLKDIEQILGYVEMRRLQGSSVALRSEDLQDLSASLTKTIIDVESYFEKVKTKMLESGQYL